MRKKIKDSRIRNINSMNDDLFIQRRRVINMLYEAKNHLASIIELPYITVRIADFNQENLLGLGFFIKNEIVISDKMKKWSDEYLRFVVYHELGHAYFNAQHNEQCILMKPVLNNNDKIGSKEDLLNVLYKLAKNKIRKKTECGELLLN